jgi:hypothetical protein
MVIFLINDTSAFENFEERVRIFPYEKRCLVRDFDPDPCMERSRRRRLESIVPGYHREAAHGVVHW